MATVNIHKLRKEFGNTAAVADFSLEIKEGELVAFLGPSGCGKTTTLRMIAGFMAPTSGTIFIGNTDVTRVPAHKRNTGMVFQRYALFPHMTVTQNISFGLEMHKMPARERDTRISAVLDMVRMTQYRDRYPRQLSGGQQQRIAIARALAIQPEVFLLDEPLSNLDAKLRVEVRAEIRELQQHLGLTTIFVTHDQEEALAIADRLAIMHEGKVQQVGTADEVYQHPGNLFVADFLGKMNFFPGRLESEHCFVSEHGARLKVHKTLSDAMRLGVRPERISLTAQPSPDDNAVPGKIEAITHLGPLLDVRLRADQGGLLNCQMPNNAASAEQLADHGRPVFACFRPSDCVLFNQ